MREMYFLLGKCARLFLLLILEAHWGAMVISLVLVKGQFFHVNFGSYHCSRTHLISDMIRHPQTSRYSWSNKELSAEARKRFFTNLIRIPATNSGCKYWPATLLGMCGLMQYNTTSPSYSLLLQVHLRMYSKFGNVENPNWISVAISMFVRSCTPKFNL